MRYGELRTIMLDWFQRGCCARCAMIVSGLILPDAPEHDIDDCLRQAVNEREDARLMFALATKRKS